MNENDRGGNEEVEINGSEDPTSSLLEDAPTEANGNPTTHHSVTNPRPTTMSKVASLLHVFLVLVLRVVFRFWKVCIAELLLVILVFWLYGGVFVFFLMVAALVTLVYNMQDFLLYFPDNPKMSTVFVPSAAILDLPYENLMIKTSDWVKISAVLLKQPPDRAARSPTIVLLHGNAGNLGHRLYNAKMLYTVSHCNVLLLDYRGYGRSEGTPSESGLYTDAQSTLDYLHTRRDIDPTQLFVFGRSLGGAVAIHIAAQKMNNGRLKGLIIENTFTSIQEMGSHLFSGAVNWVPLCLVKNKFLSNRKVSSIHAPTLFLAGTADELVPPKMMKDLFMRCRAPKKSMYCFTGGSHNETWHCENYFQTIRDFLWKIPGSRRADSSYNTHPHSNHPHHHHHQQHHHPYVGPAVPANASSVVFNA
ncbi:protein ABHD13 [Strongylocentrotus purpuratus]|uniref:Protein ABHD13 n=1 Tax=Strongylocentrotus purpuratus TaxID=7668 RepID=A0A7M7THD1_STRPU|nr:protein ABHD13 [Strongylocentrotus purpuratus]|eukprot:XP_796285.2 PREDICTED: alpha/beta hydrolase domain-containing protein 13 [Strongylocentrotus purpuratus]